MDNIEHSFTFLFHLKETHFLNALSLATSVKTISCLPFVIPRPYTDIETALLSYLHLSFMSTSQTYPQYNIVGLNMFIEVIIFKQTCLLHPNSFNMHTTIYCEIMKVLILWTSRFTNLPEYFIMTYVPTCKYNFLTSDLS